MRIDAKRCIPMVTFASFALYIYQNGIKICKFLVCRATAIHANHLASGNQRQLAACTAILVKGRKYLVCTDYHNCVFITQ